MFVKRLFSVVTTVIVLDGACTAYFIARENEGNGTRN